jgi:hypothetical protein
MSFTNFNDVAKSKNQEVVLTHVATNTTVAFPAFLTEYRDTYQVGWGSEKIFGRNDPIKPYQDTTRRLSVGFDVLSPNFTSAIENLEKFQTLVRMMYPVYSAPLDGSGGSVGRTIKAPPLLRVKFVNMIQSAGAAGGALLGCIEGVNFEPDKEMGYFVERSGELYPKKFNISFNFVPQHESPLGWDAETTEFLTKEFPYSTGRVSTSVTNQGGDNARLNSANIDRLLTD